MKEVWMPIKDYENLYEISNLGRVKSLRRFVKNRDFYVRVNEKILKPGFNGKYYQVHLCKNGKSPLFEISRLVAESFIINPENKPEVNHEDGNKLNNFANNLEWNTNSENQLHAYKTGLKSAKGSKNGRSKLKESDIIKIKAMYNSGKYLQKEIASIYGVTRACIGHIINNTRWNERL
jgi:DNA-binding XRE family transcriptional regulator